MNQSTLPRDVLDDLFKFISTYYHLPHPLLIAQAFCLKHPKHGRKYGLTTITEAAEFVIKQNRTYALEVQNQSQ
jgi:hypothetical protein